MDAFLDAMRLDTPDARDVLRMGAIIDANAARWARMDALYALADAGTITSAEAVELRGLERGA